MTTAELLTMLFWFSISIVCVVSTLAHILRPGDPLDHPENRALRAMRRTHDQRR